jgi:hypothetical protein
VRLRVPAGVVFFSKFSDFPRRWRVLIRRCWLVNHFKIGLAAGTIEADDILEIAEQNGISLGSCRPRRAAGRRRTHRDHLGVDIAEGVEIYSSGVEEQTRPTHRDDPAQPPFPQVDALVRAWPVSASLGANTYILSGYSLVYIFFNVSSAETITFSSSSISLTPSARRACSGIVAWYFGFPNSSGTVI